MDTGDELLDAIREVKHKCNPKLFDYKDGYGELCHMVFTALDIADELREAVLVARKYDMRLVYGRDVPGHYAQVIQRQLTDIGNSLARGRGG